MKKGSDSFLGGKKVVAPLNLTKAQIMPLHNALGIENWPQSVQEEFKHCAGKIRVPDEEKLVAIITGGGVIPSVSILSCVMSPLDIASVAFVSSEDAIIAMIDNRGKEETIIPSLDAPIFFRGEEEDEGKELLKNREDIANYYRPCCPHLFPAEPAQPNAFIIKPRFHGSTRNDVFVKTKKAERAGKSMREIKNARRDAGRRIKKFLGKRKTIRGGHFIPQPA